MRHSDGAILALVGGKDWDEKQFNVAVQARRQPGSAFKPLTLIAALEEGIASDQLFDAAPFEVLVKDEMWNVTNYGGGQPADRMNLRASTVASVNTVYARLIIEVGPEKVVDLAHEMGFTADMEPDPALSLGGLRYGVSPLEMAHAYTTMARAGSDIEPRTITRITTASAVDVVVEESDYDAESIAVTNAPPDEVGDESSVQVLYQAPEFPEERRIYSEETGNEVASILRESVTSGTGRRANISGIDVSGKTGTTQNYHDAWFVGWAEGVTTAVWMGFPEAQIEMRDIRGRNVSGGSYPAQIFHDFMIAALEERPSYGLYYVAREPGGLWIPEFDDDDFAGSIFGDIPTLEEIGQAP
jgi:penicillin-binding protein 1A